MRSTQELAKNIDCMVSSLENMKSDALPLEGMMDEFSKAIEAYGEFCEKTSQGDLKVFEIKVDEAGNIVQSDFEWKDM